EEITPDYLRSYETHLRTEGIKGNYVHKLLVGVRTLFNAAIKRDIIKCYPFKSFELPTYRPPVKDFLSVEELKEMEVIADQSTGRKKITAIYFLLGCYTGLRVSDWYTFDPIKHVQD